MKRNATTAALSGALVLAFAATASAASANRYVDVGYTGGGSDGSEAHPYTTLADAMTNANNLATLKPTSGSIVYVAPGTYDQGYQVRSSKLYRVIVDTGVTLQGAGAEKTIIVGAPDLVDGTEANYYCGTNAIRCAYLLRLGSEGRPPILRDCTLTGGHTPSTGSYGGACMD